MPDTQNLDLYCLHCGYNLRGLSTDPRRCPECGHENALDDLLVPAQEIKRALDVLESAPAMATSAIVVVLVWFLPALAALHWVRFRAMSHFFYFVIIGGIAVCIVVYIFGVRKFRTTCYAQPGWVSALIRHHFFGLLAAVCVTALVGACLFVITLLGAPRGISRPDLYIAGGVGVVSFAGTRFFGRLAKRSIVPLQRRRAAQMATGCAPSLDS